MKKRTGRAKKREVTKRIIEFPDGTKLIFNEAEYRRRLHDEIPVLKNSPPLI
jgi:hypothetical protein